MVGVTSSNLVGRTIKSASRLKWKQCFHASLVAPISSVKRNLDRFPDDFMFRLNDEEYDVLRSQFATSSSDHGGRRYQPLVFTENGVAMLSTVLKSKTAVQVNISIMRIFTKLRSFHALEQRLDNKVNSLEKNITEVFKVVFQRLDEVQKVEEVSKRRKIGL